MEASQLHTLFLIIHLFGVALGAGGAFMSDGAFFVSLKDRKISKDEFSVMKYSSQMTWIGLVLLLVSGAGLFGLNPEALSQSTKFLVKMTIVGILLLNGVVFHIVHLPLIGKRVGSLLVKKNKPNDIRDAPYMFLSGVISMVSWSAAIILGALSSIPFSYGGALSIYVGLIGAGALSSALLFGRFLDKKNIRNTVVIGTSIVLMGLFLFISVFLRGNFFEAQNNVATTPSIDSISEKSYSRGDISLHNSKDDCWVIVDNLIFDVTEAARLHPASFNCGTDVSENYHKNHGKGIRDKMMQFYIGQLNNLQGASNVDAPFTKYAQLDPYPEVYAELGSWNNEHLMVVVEKDAENVVFIDGLTHEMVGRVYGVGYQPHTSVFSRDAQYMYIVSRDGWLSKIDLDTLEPTQVVSVGENSRGTAFTDDGKYIAIGNYEPGNIVILDAETLDILKEIPLEGEKDGEIIASRAGAVVENGSEIIVALKDLTSVWVVDTTQEGFPVTHKFSNIGGGVPALHDGYLTPEGRYFIVASQGSHTVWVLDLENKTIVGEIETGDTPHTGSGATWGNVTYVPSLGEGLITGIDMTTWEVVAQIPTGGPGLFIRSYPRNPEYPYVWADTAFGDKHDEIYVIDARTNTIVETIIPVPGESSWHPEFTYDGKFVYVVSQTANEIEVYDAYSFALVKRISANTPSAVSNVGLRIEELGL